MPPLHAKSKVRLRAQDQCLPLQQRYTFAGRDKRLSHVSLPMIDPATPHASKFSCLSPYISGWYIDCHSSRVCSIGWLPVGQMSIVLNDCPGGHCWESKGAAPRDDGSRNWINTARDPSISEPENHYLRESSYPFRPRCSWAHSI